MHERTAERASRELGKHCSRRRPVIRDDPAAQRERRVERGDGGVSDDRFWSTRRGIVVDRVEDAHRAVPAAQTPDRVHIVVAQNTIEIRDALIVTSCEVALASERVLAYHRIPPERLDVAD